MPLNFQLFSLQIKFLSLLCHLTFSTLKKNNTERIKMRGRMQQLIASYFTTQTSYPRTQEFRDKVTQHKESRMSLNCHKYSFFTQSRQKNGTSVLVRVLY